MLQCEADENLALLKYGIKSIMLVLGGKMIILSKMVTIWCIPSLILIFVEYKVRNNADDKSALICIYDFHFICLKFAIKLKHFYLFCMTVFRPRT